MGNNLTIRATFKKEFLEEYFTLASPFFDTVIQQLPKLKNELITIIKALEFDREIDTVFYEFIWIKLIERKKDYKNNKQNYKTSKGIFLSYANIGIINSIIPNGVERIIIKRSWMIRGWLLEEIIKFAFRKDNIFDAIKNLKKESLNDSQLNNEDKPNKKESKEGLIKTQEKEDMKPENIHKEQEESQVLDDEDFENMLQF